MKHWALLAAMGILISTGSAQPYQRRATITGGGDRDRGKCTIEVVVDGAAEIEIRGDLGSIRNLSGRPPQWRRFECTSPMPANAANFRFAGVDGRGRQQLTRDPRDGGIAVIRIDDPQGGAEGYTFDLTWGGSYTYNPGAVPRPPDAGGRTPFRRFTTEQAVAACQDAVRQRTLADYPHRSVEFRETRIDDQPGRNDWVIGTLDILSRGGPLEQHMRFSCAVNFDTGQVRSADLQPLPESRHGGGADRMATQRALDGCQQAVRARMMRDADTGVEITSIRVDNAPGRNDWVIGTLRVDRGRGFDTYNFSCSVDLRDGDVRSVDVTRR
jgi:hypothetical protein